MLKLGRFPDDNNAGPTMPLSCCIAALPNIASLSCNQSTHLGLLESLGLITDLR
jgi:hypothetical protein